LLSGLTPPDSHALHLAWERGSGDSRAPTFAYKRLVIAEGVSRDMAEPYPPTEPHKHGLLDVGDGNLVYWETRGNPSGKPALVVHGGPGSGCEGSTGRSFNPDRYRVVLFDQRGCGEAGRRLPPVRALALLTSIGGKAWVRVPSLPLPIVRACK
jgi:hypothetical protein